MTTGYMHGVYGREIPSELVPGRYIESNVVVALGTAPVHTLADIAKAPANTPVLCQSYTDFVSAFGWSDDWDAFTLCEVASSHFAKFGAAPVVFVNVLDPARHTEAVADERAVFGEKDVVTLKHVPVSSPTVTDDTGVTTYMEGTDYTVDRQSAQVRRLEGGTIEKLGEVKVSYSRIAPEAVTDKDIIGGVDAKSLKKTGLELVDEVFPRFRIVPSCLIAPKFGESPAVAISSAAKMSTINSLFTGITIMDIPTSEVPSLMDAPGWKEKNSLTDPALVMTWPEAKLGDRRYHLSTLLAGCISAADADEDGTPCASPSNKRLYMDRAVVRRKDGRDDEVWFDLTANNYLNSQGIVTANNFDGGWKSWGNRTACYPGNTDPKDAFIAVRRFFNWYKTSFILTYFSKVDVPLRRRIISTIVKSEQHRLDGLTAQEKINGGRIVFLDSENPKTDLIDGLLRFHLYIAPPVPARAIEGVFEFDATYVSNLFK